MHSVNLGYLNDYLTELILSEPENCWKKDDSKTQIMTLHSLMNIEYRQQQLWGVNRPISKNKWCNKPQVKQHRNYSYNVVVPFHNLLILTVVSLTFLRSTFLGNKDIWFRKSEFVADLISLIENYAKSRKKRLWLQSLLTLQTWNGRYFIFTIYIFCIIQSILSFYFKTKVIIFLVAQFFVLYLKKK